MGELRAKAADVRLWWPAGMGGQPLYNVTAEISELGDGTEGNVAATRRVGFRSLVLVMGNDTEPGFVEREGDKHGTLTQGMLLRVNGAAVMSKGANMIPMEELEGRMSAT